MSGVPYHAWTHAPKEEGGTDPISGFSMERVFGGKFDATTIATDSTTNITGYDTGASVGSTNMTFDETNGRIELLATGLYIVQFHTMWDNAFAFGKMARIAFSGAGSILSDHGSVQNWVTEEDAGTSVDQVVVQTLVMVTDIGFTGVLIQGAVRQISGVDKDLASAELSAIRLSAVIP